MVKIVEAFEAHKRACVLYGYNIGWLGEYSSEEQYAYWQEQVLVTEKALVDIIVELVKAERNNTQPSPTGRLDEKFNDDDGKMVKIFNKW